MANTSLAHGTRKSINEQIKQRVDRGALFFREHGEDIVEVGDGVYLVPSTGRPGTLHRVTLTDSEECCSCEDFEFWGSKHDTLCYHGYAAAIKRAHDEQAERRRRKAREVVGSAARMSSCRYVTLSA